MTQTAANERAALLAAAQSEGLLPPEAAQHTPEESSPSWALMALGFVGAQLVVWPFLAFLVLLETDFFFEAPGVWVATAVLLGGASAMLRRPRGMFVTQMAFSGLLAGLGLLVVALEFDPFHLLVLAVLLGLALLVQVAWVQRVLGVLATVVALGLTLGPRQLEDMVALYNYPSTPMLVALALLWACWCAREPQWSVHAWARRVAALADGAGVALLLATVLASGRQFWFMHLMGEAARGSADDGMAGLANILHVNGYTALQLALVLGAAVWLARHWQLHQRPYQRTAALLGLVCAVLALACLVVPQIGVVALIGAVALGTGRRALLALVGVVLLAQLSGFYYALQWPLAHKAALLAGTGAALALALWALRERRTEGAAVADAHTATGPRRWLAPVLIALAGAGALGMVHRDVQHKEQVIAQGQKIYVPLAPRDPRSLMQGDYMALNFDFPSAIRQQLEEDSPRLNSLVQVVAKLDARGVAEVLRVAQSGEALAAGELLLPLKYMQREWVLVTDAFFFPEGQGEVFNAAQFGEFRALPDGRALLVGLADKSLQPIAAAPRQQP